ncbi:MAG: hypothetical protein ACLFQB_02885 [Chitinispirillaceae bacterium]
MTFRFCLFLLTVSLLPGVNGCAPGVRCYGPQFTSLESSVKRVGILTPEIFSYDVSAGGIYEYRDDWSRKATEQVMTGSAEKLGANGRETVFLHDSADGFYRLKNKLRYHSSAIQSTLYGENCLVTQIDSFTFSVGSLDSLCDLHGVDGFLYIYGYDEQFSPQRVQMLQSSANAKTARSACFGVLLGVLTGYFGFTRYQAPPERTFVAAIIAQRNGKVKWYKHYFNGDDSDLRNSTDTGKILDAVMKGMTD